MISINSLPKNSIEKISLTAVIDTALCVGAGGSSGSLADKPIIRNAQGQLLIPGSQLKGRLRHECEKLARALGWQIFQSPSAAALCLNESLIEPRFQEVYRVPGYRGFHCLISQVFGNPILPSRILVDDLVCLQELENFPEVLRPGVTINRTRRTAEEKKLYFLETSPANAQLPFEGCIYLQPNCPSYAKALIAAGLRHIHALGGSKSAGLGWLTWKQLPTLDKNDDIWLSLIPKINNETN